VLYRVFVGGRVGAGLAGSALVLITSVSQAIVLPENRSDALYHYYDGGGVTVSGPALLVRKNIGESLSISGRYYADAVSSASIDVVTQASPYKDKRNELGAGIDYLRGNTLVGFSYTTSKENDYLADTLNISVAHEIFGGMTTVNLGYAQGDDTVKRVDTDFEDHVDRYNYRLGVSQVLTKRWVMSLDYESVLDSGYLQNPYRYAVVQGVFVPESYPRTRDSNTVTLRSQYGLGTIDNRLTSSLTGYYRYFWDTWDVRAHTLELGYQLRGGMLGADHWTAGVHYRYYTQDAASFYSDNFATELQYMARDKELSTFQSHLVGLSLTRAFGRWSIFDRGSLNAAYDFTQFKYDDFTDVRNGELYSFNAHILQLFLSLWY
jgi:hypothetical protein